MQVFFCSPENHNSGGSFLWTLEMPLECPKKTKEIVVDPYFQLNNSKFQLHDFYRIYWALVNLSVSFHMSVNFVCQRNLQPFPSV